nr:uncharacterized protein LOC127321370 [Lolium perenne]
MEEEEETPEGGGEGGGDAGGGGEGGGDAEDSGDGGGEDAGRRRGEECDGLPVPAKLAPAKRYRQGSYLDDQYWKTCESNKANRAKVQFQQKTGSRSYTAHIYALNEERKGEPLSAIDYFKATHNGKTGYAEPVQKSIAEMEKRMVAPLQEG